MGLIKCGCVARGVHAICEYDASVGGEDLTELARQALPQIPRTQKNKFGVATASQSSVFQGKKFQYLEQGDLLFLSIVDVHDTNHSTELVHEFLVMMRQAFLQNVTVQNQERGTQMLRKLISEFNSNCSTTQLQAVEQELHQVTDIMKQNIDCVLARGERMNSLVEKSQTLRDDSVGFRKAAHDAQKRAWWQTQRNRLYMFVFGVAITYLLAAVRYGPTLGVFLSSGGDGGE
eukprot:g16175.t1